MNLFEKLNRLDDSLVESKRVVKKKKLTESTEKTTIEVKFEPYTRYGYEPVKTARISGKNLLDALLNMSDRMHLYVNSDYADDYEDDYGVKLTAETFLERIEEENGDGCDFVFYIKNLTTGEMLFDSGYEESEDWDDDIDEMLTEAELSPWEKIVKTFPDDFEHQSANKTPAQHKTMNDYARDPNTPTLDSREITTKPEMSARDKLLKTFPDLDIRSSKDFLKEAVKDTDYVIAYVHPVSTFSKRCSFLGSNYRMTKDLDKAMTYTSKFSAEDEIKYAKDEVERIVDSSTSTGYASNFAADSDRFLVVTVAQARELLKNPDKKVSRAVSNNSEAQKAAKPVATEIHSIIKKYNVSLSSFLMLIKEIIKAEDPEA